jgi:hypothetical protein
MNVQSKTLLFSMFAISSLSAMEGLSSSKLTKIKASSIFSTNEVGKVDLFRDDKGYHVVRNNEVYTVNQHSVDPLLKSLKHKQLKKFQKCGYIHVKMNQENEFSLVSKIRGNGGGPYTAYLLYSATKALCYGGLFAAAGTVVGATGGGALVVAGAGEIIAVSGSGIAAVAIGGSAAATQAAATLGTAAALTTGISVAIEGASCGAGAFGLWLPLP